MKNVIFSDVDGTIYDHDRQVLESTIADVNFAKQHGCEFVICTGNPFFGLMQNLCKIFNIDYIITSNGAEIINVKTKQRIFHQRLPKKIALELLAFANTLGLGADWWDEEHLYFSLKTDQTIVDYWKNVEKFPIIITNEIVNDPFKIEFYDHSKQADKIDKMFMFAKRTNLQVARMKPYHIEVTMNNVSKGAAIAWMANHFGFDLSHTMGIGDSYNDVEMFKTVKYSFAMQNAPDDIKDLTKFTTDHVLKNGLGQAIRIFVRKIQTKD